MLKFWFFAAHPHDPWTKRPRKHASSNLSDASTSPVMPPERRGAE
jgi:hypothetical protein